MSKTYLSAFMHTFGNAWGILSIIIGAVGFLNLRLKYSDLDLAPFVEDMIFVYQWFFHGSIDYVLSLVDLDISELLKDILVLYFLFASVTMRAQTAMIKTIINEGKKVQPGSTIADEFGSTVTRKMMIETASRPITAFLLWPVLAWRSLKRGTVYRVISVHRDPAAERVIMAPVYRRVTWLINVLAVFLAFRAVIALNSALLP